MVIFPPGRVVAE
jgi:hypothetical protein